MYINVKKFPTGNKKAKDNGDENEIYFMYEDKQYKYLVDSDCYNSDDKPNLFLLSYNTNAIMFDETIASLYLHKAFIALAYYIADDLKNSIPKDTVSNTKIMFKGIERTPIKILRSIDKCINYLFKYLKASKNDEYIPKLEDMHDIYNIITLRDKKRNHLLNVERLATMVSYFINNEITEEDKQIINSIQFPIVKRKNKNAKNEYIDSKEFEEIKELKSFIAYYIRKKSINAIIKRDFGTESYPDEKQYSQPLFNLLQFLAIKGFENDKEKAKLRNRYYSQQIGLIGFFESENQEKKYTKTFLGKNPFQLLCDLRICSHCFKIETIVEKDKIITSGLNKDGLRKLKELEKKIKNEKTNLKLNTKLDLLSDENKIIKFKLPNGMAASPIPIPFTIPVFIATSFVWISKKIYKEWVKNNKRLNDVPYKDGDNVTINYIINDKTISKLDIAKRLGVQPNEIVIVDDLENKNVGDVINIIVYNDYFVDKYNYKYDKSVDFELSYVFKDEKNYTTAAFDLLSEHSILKEIFSVYNNPIGELKKLLILQNEDNYSDTIYLNLKITKEIADKYGMDYNNNSTKKK